MSFRLGRDEQFDDNLTIRLKAVDLAVDSYLRTAAALRAQEIDPLLSINPDPPTFFMLPQGHQANLMFDARALFQANRELVDLYLGRLWGATANSGSRTPVKFKDFIPRLASGQYEARPEPIFAWLKQNIGRLYTIRAVRNELKVNPSSAQFLIDTNRFLMKISLPFAPQDEVLAPFLNLRNLDQALANGRIFCTLDMDHHFLQARHFWEECGKLFELSFSRGEVFD
jgi:hypothetical protein